MPFIHIKSLPLNKGQVIPEIVSGIALDFANNTGIKLEHIHTTWEFYPAGHYAKGKQVADVQPESHFPIIVDLLVPDFNDNDAIKKMLKSIAKSIATRAAFPENNIFINCRRAHSARVFDDGEVVHW